MNGVFNYSKAISSGITTFSALYGIVQADHVVTTNEWIYVAVATAVVAFFTWLIPNVDVKGLLAQLVDNAAKVKQTPPIVNYHVTPSSNTVETAPVKVDKGWLPDYTD